MELLNDIANAFKHSFINSGYLLLGAEKPRIHALELKYNTLSSKPIFHNGPLLELINKYNAFYKSCVSWLLAYSERNR